MKIKELLAKVLAEGPGQLTDEERDLLSKYEDVDADKLANDRAARARAEAEKKAKAAIDAATGEKAALEAQLAELQTKFDTATGKEKTQLEVLQGKIEKMDRDLATERKARETAQAENASLVRSHKVDAIFARIANSDDSRLAEGVDPSDVRELLGARLAAVDLDDKDLVGATVEQFRGRNKALFTTPGAGGTGSGGASGAGGAAGGAGGAGGGGGRLPKRVNVAQLLEDAVSGDPAEVSARLKEASAAIRAGAQVEGRSAQ